MPLEFIMSFWGYAGKEPLKKLHRSPTWSGPDDYIGITEAVYVLGAFG